MEFKPLLRERSWDIKKENEILELWDKEDIYTFKLIDEKPLFVIDTPPPYASGSWHVAAAAHYAQFDMFARYYKLKGYNILFPMGIDRNGLPIEITVEKIYGIRAKEVDREYFINLCRELLDKYEKEIIEIVKRMGLMANYKNPYKTDSPEYRKITQATFIELWNRNLIYKAERPTIWCPVCYTTIAEAEVEYKQTEGTLYYIRFDLSKGDYVVVATTRPELLGATAALLYNPKDERYKDLKDNKAIIPIYNYSVPILEHPSVKPEFGSGVMMLSSFGDLEDIRLFRELGFKPRILIDKDGKMNELAGKYHGLSVEEARKAIVKDLKDIGYVIKEEKISQNIPICWRSKNPVEFIITDALYLKQLEFKNEIKKIADEIAFLPDFHKQILINWIDGLSIDWAISRDRYYGTEIPIWYCKKCGEPHVPEPGEYYIPWKDAPPFKKCKKCGSTEFIGETRTFDTWFDSSISPLYISGYLRDEKLYRKAFPVTVRPQGIDIVRTWLYYTLLRVYLLTGRPAFKFVRLSGMGLDKHGRPMHKHLGNIVYPLPIIEKYGADAFRLWAASETKLGYNYQFNEEKIRGAKKFINKLWNISRFISSFPYVRDGEIDIEELTKIDKEILSLLNSLIDQAEEEYSHLDTFYTSNKTRNFAWNIFASHYIELVKPRAYNKDNKFTQKEQRSAWYTLHKTLRTILLLMHPVIPFITDYIWRELYNKKGILTEGFPSKIPIKLDKSLLNEVIKLNSIIWRRKDKAGVSLKNPVRKIILPIYMQEYERDLKELHNIQEIAYSTKVASVDEVQIYL